MRYWARLVCILSLVAFAIGVVAYSAGTTTMASAMVTANAGMTANDDCNACDDSEPGFKGAACDFACNAASAVNYYANAAVANPAATPDRPAFQLAQITHGMTGPPAKHPPRIFL